VSTHAGKNKKPKREKPGKLAASSDADMNWDDHENRSLPAEMVWVWREVLPPRRRIQGVLVLGFMLVGGLAELLTLGSVVPLLALFASSGAPRGSTRTTQLMAEFGIDLAGYSLSTFAAIFCGVAVATCIIRIALSWVGQRYVFAIRHDLSLALYDRMLRQPYAFHIGVNSSRILSCLGNIPGLASGMLMPMLQAMIAIIIGTCVFVGLLILSPLVSIAATLCFGLIYKGLSLATGQRLRSNALTISKMNYFRLQTIQEGLGGIADVLLDNSQPVYLRKFATIDRQLRDAQGANSLISAMPRFIAEAAGIILMVILALILYQQQGGAVAALPILGALALGAQRLLPLMQQVYFGWASVLNQRSMFFETVTLLQRPIPSIRSNVQLPQFHSQLELKSVDFAYGRDQSLTLKDISLRIPKGARVGFVGKTGSGKTTLLNLVMGLLDPVGGEICIDRNVLTSATKQSWQRQVAHVPQSIFLIDGSIAQNIALGVPDPEIDFDKLRRVSQMAAILDFVDSLDRGFDTSVGERGVRLSGGQIQRIGLARALYKDATVLVLDEATSALDDSTEAGIIEAVQHLGEDYTVLMIAHRTTTLRDCDLIFRLDRGRLVESGTPEVVLGVKKLSAKAPLSARQIGESRKAAGHE
jgi:ABC-type multidrug transport system fused ATPase/permease subunit